MSLSKTVIQASLIFDFEIDLWQRVRDFTRWRTLRSKLFSEKFSFYSELSTLINFVVFWLLQLW